MLHASTSVLTPTGFVPISTLKVDDILKTYFGTSKIKRIDQETYDLMKVSSGSAQVMCSTNQEFLLKADTGYVFDIPKTGDELVKYAVSSSTEDMLMTLQVAQDVSYWGKGNFYRIHLNDDFLLIITDYLVVRT